MIYTHLKVKNGTFSQGIKKGAFKVNGKYKGKNASAKGHIEIQEKGIPLPGMGYAFMSMSTERLVLCEKEIWKGEYSSFIAL